MRNLTIGKAANAAGVSIDTVRFYEREGLLPSVRRSASGYRLYSQGDVDRLRFVRRAKGLGFALGDIRDLLRLQDNKGKRREVKSVAERRLADLDQRLAELSALRTALASLVESCSGQGSIQGCPIIEGVIAFDATPCKEHS